MLIGLSGQLNTLGVIKAFADAVGGVLASMNLAWQPLFGLLHLAFFYLHYMFASQTAHVGALYSAFCAMMLAAGARGAGSVFTSGPGDGLVFKPGPGPGPGPGDGSTPGPGDGSTPGLRSACWGDVG